MFMWNNNACQKPAKDAMNAYQIIFSHSNMANYGQILPMISVTKAEINTIIKVTVINKGEGPFSKESVAIHNLLYKGPMTKITNNENPTAVKNTYNASMPPEEFKSATTRASKTLSYSTN